MGCCCETIKKYQIPQQPRVYKGDIVLEKQQQAKFKSKSSKTYAGTNTYCDIQHENQPIKRDIYERYRRDQSIVSNNSQKVFNFAGRVHNLKYVLNPYQSAQDVYGRSKTDNPLKNIQGRQLGQNLNSVVSQNQILLQNHQQNKEQKKQHRESRANQMDYSASYRQSDLKIRGTQSKFFDD